MKKINTIFFPYHLENNTYCDLIVRALKQKNIEVKKLSYALKHPNYLFSTKIINFNFFENIPNNISITKAKIQYYSKCVFLCFCKSIGMKIIYTLHNKRQHDGKYNKLNQRLMEKLIRESDVIVSLCTEGKELIAENYGEDFAKKTYIIPHPNYCTIVEYKNEETLSVIRKKIGADQKMLCTFLGAISPYKNIELIIRAANELEGEDIIFLIAGNSKDQNYVDSLKKMSTANNIIWDIRFVPEQEAEEYIAASDLILLPYNKKSSLNSGSVFWTMTLRKTCVIPNIGTIKDLKNVDDIYVYDYSSDEEHYIAFVKALSRAVKDYKKDAQTFSLQGTRLYKEMVSNHSLDCIGNKYLKLYENLL